MEGAGAGFGDGESGYQSPFCMLTSIQFYITVVSNLIVLLMLVDFSLYMLAAKAKRKSTGHSGFDHAFQTAA